MVTLNRPAKTGALVSGPMAVVEMAAMKYYAGPRGQDGTFPFRTFLRLDWLRPLSVLVGRPFNLEEMRLMVDFDGTFESETCLFCGKKFTPVRWIDLLDPNLCELLANGISPSEAIMSLGDRLLTFGAFYKNEGTDGGYGSFCGSPYIYNDAQSKYFPADAARSHLWAVMESDPQKHWGTCRKKLDAAFASDLADLADAQMELVQADIAKAAFEAEQKANLERAKAFHAAKNVAKTGPKTTSATSLQVRSAAGVPTTVTLVPKVSDEVKHHESRALIFVEPQPGELGLILLETNGGKLKTVGGTNREAIYENELPEQTVIREIKEETGLTVSDPSDLKLVYQEVHKHHGHKLFFYLVLPGKYTGVLREEKQMDGEDLQLPPKVYSLGSAKKKILPLHRPALMKALEELAPQYAEAAMHL